MMAASIDKSKSERDSSDTKNKSRSKNIINTMLTIDDNDDFEPICYSLFIEEEDSSNTHQSSHGFVEIFEINTLSENDNDLSHQENADGSSNIHQSSHGFVEVFEINTLSEDDNDLSHQEDADGSSNIHQSSHGFVEVFEINTLSEDDNDLSHQEDADGLHDADDSVKPLDEESSEDEYHDWIIDSRTNITADALAHLQILGKGTAEILCKAPPHYGEGTYQDQMDVQILLTLNSLMDSPKPSPRKLIGNLSNAIGLTNGWNTNTV
jgi:hypothetical protein